MAIDVSGIDMPTSNIYVMNNTTCDVSVNSSVFDDMAGDVVSNTLSGVTHGDIQGANNNDSVTLRLNNGLTLGATNSSGNPICTT